MTPKPVASLRFTDALSHDEIYVGIQATQGRVALALSLKDNGDIEVVLRLDECEQLVQGLQRALLTARE